MFILSLNSCLNYRAVDSSFAGTNSPSFLFAETVLVSERKCVAGQLVAPSLSLLQPGHGGAWIPVKEYTNLYTLLGMAGA
jgi:hypothetical protein